MAKNNSPNSNINHVNIVEGLISQVSGHLEVIYAKDAEQQNCINNAILAIAEFQENALFKLRKAFE